MTDPPAPFSQSFLFNDQAGAPGFFCWPHMPQNQLEPVALFSFSLFGSQFMELGELIRVDGSLFSILNQALAVTAHFANPRVLRLRFGRCRDFLLIVRQHILM